MGLTKQFNCIARIFLLISYGLSVLATVVPSPPTIIKQPPAEGQLFQVAVGPDDKEKPFVLDCEATGEPLPTYEWTKSGRKFDWQAYDNRISQQPGRGTLVVTSPTDVDEGYYQCLAINEHGTALSNGVFVRKSELGSFADERIEKKTVEEGQTLTLECHPPTGYPKPNIFWIIQSKAGALRSINSSRITVDPEGQLHFSNVTKEDSYDDAYYACSASIVFRNEYKLGSKVELTVVSAGGASIQTRRGPEKQYVSPPNIVAQRGQALDIFCIFGGSPLPEIRWKKRGSELPPGRYTTTNYGKTLKLKKVDFEDEGTYECTASNGVSSVQSWSVTVTVQAVPYWISEPNDTNAAEDEDVTFECKASGVPEPEIRWFMNGVELEKAPPNPRRKLVSPTVLKIDQLVKSDTAVYQCNASNALGYVFKNFYVNVLALAPEITEPPEKLYETVDGLTIVLSCRVFGAPKPEVKWNRNDKELTGGRYTTLESGDLEIRNALFPDAGHYKCIAKNKFGEVSSRDDVGFLEVKERTRITAEPEDFEVAVGDSATFRCNAISDNSLDLTIDWLNNDQLIDFDQDPRMIKGADYSLVISKATELDSGTYTCVARTRLDNITSSASLIVQDVPNPPRLVGVECNRLTARIEWQPMGDNRAPILGYIIQHNTSFRADVWEESFGFVPAADFKFEVPMSPWANYSFRVIARNKVGPSFPSEHSQPCQTPPDVPYKNPENVMGKGSSPDNLVISWTMMPPIEQNAPGFYYRVYYRLNVPGNAWEPPVDISDWQTSQYVVKNQPTFKEYVIKVEAHNSMGQANVAATEVIGYSGEDVPLEAPTNLTLLEIVDATTASLSWNPVHPDSVRGHFKGYKIQTWTTKETNKQTREMIVAANVTNSVVKMFVPYSQNKVRVLVFNGAHDGPPSDILTFDTPEGRPGPVASLDAVPMGSTALYLMWKKPVQPNGLLTGYRIYYEKVEGTKLGQMEERDPPITDPKETRAKLGKLEPGTKYRITIRATTSQGPGDIYYIEFSTRNAVAGRPDKPTFTWELLPNEDRKAAIKVTWLPNVDGLPGSHFYVQYRIKGATQWEQTDHELNHDSVIISGLETGTVYEIRVVAVDGDYDNMSEPEEIETSGAPVYAPQNPNSVATAGWFVGMMCAIAFLLLILIIVCIIKRNRGGKYSVHEKEAARAQEMDYPEDAGFNEYTRPPGDRNNVKGSRTSLSSSVKPVESDTDSMADYGEGETGKFTEDGSFIGQYGANKRKERDETSPGAMATFV